MKMLIKSTLIGCVLGTLPEWPLRHLGTTIEAGCGILMLPGLLVGLVFSRGWLHDVSVGVAVIANCAFYTLLSYAILRMRRSRR